MNYYVQISIRKLDGTGEVKLETPVENNKKETIEKALKTLVENLNHGSSV